MRYARTLNHEFCNGIITGLGCSGSYGDNVQLRCTPFSSGGVRTGCSWTAAFSEEEGSQVFRSDHAYVAVGAQCSRAER